MNETLEYLQMFARFPFALRRFLKHKLTLEEARQIVRERMEHREENFLRVVEKSIYGYPRSPYLALLKMAGCELSDLRALVKQKGLEGALRQLREEGVYVTFEESKGRKPIVRNGLALQVTPRHFDNPAARRVFNVQTGGSTGVAVNIGTDLDQIAARAPHELLTSAAWGVLDAPTVYWRGILPDSTLSGLLQIAASRGMPTRWFSHLGLRQSKHWIKYGLATYHVLLWMRVCGVSVPFPEYVAVRQADLIARCLGDILRIKQSCFLRTSVSRALRVCLEAEKAGISFKGLTIRAGGEPATPAKVSAIERVGARFLTNYALTEAGTLGNGCVRGGTCDDVHLFHDAFVLTSHPHRVKGVDVTVPAFNLTTLLPTARKLLLNLQMGDYGVIEQRSCGCEFESLGYTTHLREIRSYDKLVTEGATLIGNDMQQILEEVLPARFGGSPLDYQLVEEEDEERFTRLYLVISPSIEIPDERAVIDLVSNELQKSSSMGDSARTVWQSANTLKIKRMEPVWTKRGKLMPLHLERHKQSK